jgi:hypothetical protein
MSRQEIIDKAVRCIDEVFPYGDNGNAPYFPVDDFLDEAALRVLRIVPLYALGQGLDASGAQITDHGDGSGSIELPAGFLRLVCLRMAGWKRPVTVAVREGSPEFNKQFNPFTRGGTAKPVAALRKGDGALEYFSLPDGVTPQIEELRIFCFSTVDDNYPAALSEITAWQAALLVLGVLGETEAVNLAENRVAQLLAIMNGA